MGRVVSEFRLHAASESLLGAAGLARSMAISRNTDIRLLVDPSSARFSLGSPDREPATWTPLPPGVGFVAVPSRPITFHNRGTAAPAGTIGIANEAGAIRVVVAVSGRIRWSRE